MDPAIREASGIARIRKLVENYIRWGTRLTGGCIFVSAATEFADRPGKFRNALQRQQKEWIESLGKIADSAVKRSRHPHRAVCFRPEFASARLPLLPADAGRRKSPQTPGGRPFRIRIGSDTVQGWQWGRGPAVLFVHGWNGRAGHFAPLVGPLLDAGFSVAADTPRHGPSSGRTSSYFQFTDAVRALLRTGSGTRLHGLVGHSTGRRY